MVVLQQLSILKHRKKVIYLSSKNSYKQLFIKSTFLSFYAYHTENKSNKKVFITMFKNAIRTMKT